MYLFHFAKDLKTRWTGLLGLFSLLIPAGAAAPSLQSPSQAAVNAAISCQFISFDRDFSGGAHTNGAWFGGASITLAVAAYAGNTAADARLLAQIRHTLTPGNEPTGNGGYPAQHERHVTAMFVIVKNTPRIWDQLTAAEKARIDLIEKACFVANSFTTSDNNPYVKADATEYALDGDSNLNRDWNPNYREGMIGGVLTGLAYYGSAGAAQTVLTNYNHAQFVAELSANNLPNLYETFNWKTANPTSKAPAGSAIEAAVDTYKYYGNTLSDHMKIYEALLNDTYSQAVNAGLNGGAGISGGGKIISGADTLPNKGATGMLKEFDSSDANGKRSSFTYAFDGYRPHMSNQIALITSGLWQPSAALETKTATRLNIGNTDLWYKAEKGYIGYAKGQVRETVTYPTYSGSRGFAYNRSLWDDVLKPFHGLGSGNPNPDPDPEPEPQPTYPAGTRVETSAVAEVRATASGTGTLVGSIPVDSFGTILAGPTTADSVEWWQVYFDNGMTGWVDAESFAAAPSSEYLTTVSGAWQNRTMTAQTGSFTISFNMRPAGNNIDALTGVSTSSASAFSNVAAVVRFATTGVVDARNGGAYAAATVFNYQTGVTYRVRMTVNVATRTYTATVTAPGGSPVTIANNYAFRTEQASATSLANIAVFAQTGSHTTSGILIEGGTAPTPPSAPTGLRIVENN